MSKFKKYLIIIVYIVIVGNIAAMLWYEMLPEPKASKNATIPSNKLIKAKMTVDEFNKLDCQYLKTMQNSDIKHQVNDDRLRKFYRFGAPLFVELLESDMKSYLEIIIDNGAVVEIIKYNENGKFVYKYNDFYCL